jgi:hypothetical protein
VESAPSTASAAAASGATATAAAAATTTSTSNAGAAGPFLWCEWRFWILSQAPLCVRGAATAGRRGPAAMAVPLAKPPLNLQLTRFSCHFVKA